MPCGAVGRAKETVYKMDGRAHFSQLANTIERLCAAGVSGDAACSRITLGSLVIQGIVCIESPMNKNISVLDVCTAN